MLKHNYKDIKKDLVRMIKVQANLNELIRETESRVYSYSTIYKDFKKEEALVNRCNERIYLFNKRARAYDKILEGLNLLGLTPKFVYDWYQQGGTLLKSSGGFSNLKNYLIFEKEKDA